MPASREGLDPRLRVVLLLGYIAAVVTTPPQRLTTFTAWAGMVAWASALAGVPLRMTMRRASAVLPFSLVAAAALPFLDGGPSVTLLGADLSVRGLWILAGVAMKSFLATAMVCIVTTSAGFEGTMDAFRALGAPSLFIDVISMSWRYLHLISEEGTMMVRAAASRGYRPRWLPQASIVGRLAGSLFVRSYERAERVHGAMLLRGYGPVMPVRRMKALRASQIALAAAALGLLAAARVVLG